MVTVGLPVTTFIMLRKCLYFYAWIFENFKEDFVNCFLKIYWGAGGEAQVVQCLFSKCKALSSNPRLQKKKYESLVVQEYLLKDLDCRHRTSSRIPALQVLKPWVQIQSHQKKKIDWDSHRFLLQSRFWRKELILPGIKRDK
jgi:hypothetical protein